MLSIKFIFHPKSRFLYRCGGKKVTCRYDSSLTQQKFQLTTNLYVKEKNDEKLDPIIDSVRHKLLYCDHLEKIAYSYGRNKNLYLDKIRNAGKEKLRKDFLTYNKCSSILLRDYEKKMLNNDNTDNENGSNSKEKPIYMPYASHDSYEETSDTVTSHEKSPMLVNLSDWAHMDRKYDALYDKYFTQPTQRNEVDSSISILPTTRLDDDLSKIPHDWMTDYEHYKHQNNEHWLVNYGTPEPDSQVSHVSCGGCGALFHCKDPDIPGYLPSELFLNQNDEDLKALICQRCHFMKHYNTALDVKVSADQYPKLLKVIKRKKTAVILVVDITDFPCSIWPAIRSVLHSFTLVFVVGNKVDLLPKDSSNFLDHIKQCLAKSVKVTGIPGNFIKYVGLTSAKTGYGIEELINQLHLKWKNKGDVYMIGCTNVGKSSLFNVLLKSDYCKIQASDLVQRATISPWPGTTINLLKFPIKSPGKRLRFLRTMRLISETGDKVNAEIYNATLLQETRRIQYATLQGRVGRTLGSVDDSSNLELSQASYQHSIKKIGLDENDPLYALSRWCYDTPGTIYSDQILDLLTTDELLLTLPTQIISPRTFFVRPQQTLFLAGLGRLDYFDGEDYIRVTVFASHQLPITMCHTPDADDVYNQLLHTAAFVVPTNNPKRLKLWPSLKSKEFEVCGIGDYESVADVVLSSSGWIAITGAEDKRITLKAWTPDGRGIHLRTPALCRKSVTHRGERIAQSPAYKKGRQVYIPR